MKNILVVDDEPEYLHSLGMGLSKCMSGCCVLTAGDGEEALRILGCTDVMLVVTDLRMPVIDGLEMLRRMRERSCRVPVVVMSAFLEDEARARLSALGVSRFLEKPVSYREVARSIENCLSAGRNGYEGEALLS